MLRGAGQDGWFEQQYLRRCIFSVMRCSTALHLGGGTKMHQTDAVSIKVSDGQLKDEHRISATISSCLMGPGADQHRVCTNRWCFGRKLQSCLLHSEKTQGDKIDLTLEDMRLQWLCVNNRGEQLLMHLLVKMDSIIGWRLDKWPLSCNSPSIKCFLDRIMVFLQSIYIITDVELQIPTNHGSTCISCVG